MVVQDSSNGHLVENKLYDQYVDRRNGYLFFSGTDVLVDDMFSALVRDVSIDAFVKSNPSVCVQHARDVLLLGFYKLNERFKSSLENAEIK